MDIKDDQQDDSSFSTETNGNNCASDDTGAPPHYHRWVSTLFAVCVRVRLRVCMHTHTKPQIFDKKTLMNRQCTWSMKKRFAPPNTQRKTELGKKSKWCCAASIDEKKCRTKWQSNVQSFFLFCFFSCFFCHLRFILAKLQNWQAARQLVSEVPLFSLLCGMNVSRLHAVCLSPLRQVSVPPRMQISRNRLSAPGARTRWLSSASSCRVK